MNIDERVLCAIHTLQLNIEKGLDIAKVLINKCKNLIAFLANNKKKQQLRESQNSTLYVFQRLIILKLTILMLKTFLINDRNSHIYKKGEKLEELYPVAHKWKIIREIVEMVKLLSPFKSITCLLSGITYPTIGLTYPSLCNLKEILETEFIQMETDIAKIVKKQS
ncbi:4592_t:CDS:2 [Funneliformis caledonium]|uniref:4592_t:CDS:1 n=1 Tax=Funneliformis caledonium TaxID=1117310 RepID=A0A9N9H388_9GLOM|nr:4592_t:CDS:2 [Funneliformis caledonium]